MDTDIGRNRRTAQGRICTGVGYVYVRIADVQIFHKVNLIGVVGESDRAKHEDREDKRNVRAFDLPL